MVWFPHCPHLESWGHYLGVVEAIRGMNCLVLGGHGFIGSHLVDLLLETDHQVRILDRAPPRFHAVPIGIEDVQADWKDKKALRTALADVDIVFHLIGTTLPASSNRNPVFDVQSNVVGTLNLLQACVEQGVKRVVFSSSGGTIYGVPQTTPIPETAPTNPISSYGITKLMIEKYLALYHRLHGLDYMIVRGSNPYGERQNPDRPQGAPVVFMGGLARGETITVWGDGSAVRDYVHVHDMARAFLLLAEAQPTGERIFNVGSGSGTSLNDLLDLLAQVTGITPRVDYQPARPFDIPVNVLDIRRIGEAVGWRPQIPLEEGLARTWAWVRHRFR